MADASPHGTRSRLFQSGLIYPFVDVNPLHSSGLLVLTHIKGPLSTNLLLDSGILFLLTYDTALLYFEMTTSTQTTPASYEIRRASPADAEQVALLGAQVFTSTYGDSVVAEDLQVYLDKNYSSTAVLADIQGANKTILVASDAHGKIVGYVYLVEGASEACIADVTSKMELERLYVLPSAHGRGVGRLLAREAEALGRKLGVTHMWLGVWEHNARAIQVYERWGYTPVGGHMFSIGNTVQTDIVMLKKLGDAV